MTLFILRGLEVAPARLPKLSSFLTTSIPSVTLPNTGCWLGVLRSNQSRKALWVVFRKNWLPPEFGRPVLAMLRVPGSLLNLAVSRNSSWML